MTYNVFSGTLNLTQLHMPLPTVGGGDIMFLVRLSGRQYIQPIVHPSVVHALTPILRDAISLYLVERFQRK